jgi:hypothetical protein
VVRVDPEYYERQAAAQLKKVATETARRADFETKAADLDEKALRAESAASSTSSDSTRRSKLRDAQRKRQDATRLRGKAAAATKAAGEAQTKATGFQGKARDERARRAKRATQQAQRDARNAERDAKRAEERRRRIDRDVATDIGQLRSKTDDLADRIAASRAAAPSKITVLLMAGTPEGGRMPLRLDRESREIDSKVRAGRYRDQIDLQATQATQVRDVIDALNRYRPDVVHFSGHGGDGALLFEGPNGAPQALAGDHLALLLQAAPKSIRLVVFNACHSADQAAAATDFAEFAIGMERSIDDQAAKEWAGQFYGSLAAGGTVDLAFRQARAHAVAVMGSEGAVGDPQLHVRPGMDAAFVVLVSPDET